MKQRFCSVSMSSFVGPNCFLIKSSFFLAVQGSFGCSAGACRFPMLRISASPLIVSVAVSLSPSCEHAKFSSAFVFFHRDSAAFRQCALRDLFPPPSGVRWRQETGDFVADFSITWKCSRVESKLFSIRIPQEMRVVWSREHFEPITTIRFKRGWRQLPYKEVSVDFLCQCMSEKPEWSHLTGSFGVSTHTVSKGREWRSLSCMTRRGFVCGKCRNQDPNKCFLSGWSETEAISQQYWFQNHIYLVWKTYFIPKNHSNLKEESQ